jgi:hypothetical protein
MFPQSSLRSPAMVPSLPRSALFTLQTPRADARIRTGDPFITSEVLYQLSYVGDSRAPV